MAAIFTNYYNAFSIDYVSISIMSLKDYDAFLELIHKFKTIRFRGVFLNFFPNPFALLSGDFVTCIYLLQLTAMLIRLSLGPISKGIKMGRLWSDLFGVV